jgi:hypothetical protein
MTIPWDIRRIRHTVTPMFFHHLFYSWQQAFNDRTAM